jgi:hypothetical protein
VVELPYELLTALESPFVGIRESAVTELGKYLRSRDAEMVELAVLALGRMKGDDSRRISLLAERLLSEFEQARTPAAKVTSPKPVPEVEAKTEEMTSVSPFSPTTTTTDIEPNVEIRASRPEVERVNLPADSPSVSQELVFDRLSWLKWSGTAFLGVIFSIILYNYSLSNFSWAFALPFGITAGLTGLAQWWWFRNRLESWWIAASVAAGAFLGAVHYYLYTKGNWWFDDFWKLSALWIIGSFVLGFILIRRTQEKSIRLSSIHPLKPVIELIEAGPGQNILVMLLSIFLVLNALLIFMEVFKESGLLSIPDSLRYASGRLTGIASISVGIFIIMKKEIPRNFGFIAFAIFAFLNGIIILIFTFNRYFPTHFITVPGMMSLLSSVFFVSQRETWKHLRYIMLSGYLIFVSSVYFGVEEPTGTNIFSIITAIFALTAAVFFFLRK